MLKSQRKFGFHLSKLRYRILMAIATLFSVAFVFMGSSSASALTTVPTLMNFQGRLTDSSGNIKPNGTYNMKLRLFTVSSAGTSVWSEDRLVSATQGVTVTNGLFTVQLGSISPLSASLFASGPLYLEVELPTPATATSSSPTWTEGPMTPRNQLATSAYAYNAETLDGLDSSAFGQLSASNTFTGTQSFTGATFSISGAANSAKFNVGSIFNVDTSASTVSIGASDTTGTVLVLDTKTGAGDPSGVAGAMYYNSSAGKFRCYEGAAWTNCIGAGGGGGGLTRKVTLVPEFPGAVISPDGSSNTGSMTSDFDGTNLHNYYGWTSSQGTLNDYDLVVRTAIPSEYTGGFGTFNIWAYGGSNSTANNNIQVTVKDASGTACASSASVLPATAATWTQQAVTLSGCTFAANDIVTISIKLSSLSNNAVRVGEMSYQYTN